MKILCSNCGLRYDPAQNHGICPHCGRYNETDDLPEGQAVDAAPDDAPPVDEEEPVWTPPPAPRRRISKTALGLLILFCFAFAAEMLIFPLVGRLTRAGQAQANFVPEAQLLSAQQGESFAFGPNERMLLVGAAQRMEGLRGVEEGGQILRVWCEAKKMQQYRSDWGVEAFVQVGTAYYPAMVQYDLESFYPELSVEALEAYELQSSPMAEGWLYFVVPADAQQYTLWFQSLTMDRGYNVSEVSMTGVSLTVEEGSVSAE